MTSVLIARTELQQALGGAPSLIVLDGVAGAAALQLEGLTVWHASASPEGTLLHRGAKAPQAGLIPLTLAMPGLLAIVAPDAGAAKPIAAWVRNVSDVSAQVVEAKDAAAALAPVTKLLLRSLNDTQARLGEAHRALAATRMDYEETRIAMGSVLRTLGNRPPVALHAVLSTRPAPLAAQPAGRHMRLRQRPGLPVREIAALAFHLATAACGPQALLRVRLVAAESGRVLGSWLLPGQALEPGWVTLDLPSPAPALRETALIEFEAELGEQDQLSLSLEDLTSGQEGVLEVLEGSAEQKDRALALRIWTAQTASRFVLARHWCWDDSGISLPEAGLPYLLPEASWSDTAVLEGHARAVGLGRETPRPIAVLEENTTTLLAPPAFHAAGLDVARVELRLLAGTAAQARAAIWLRDPAQLENPADPVLNRPGTRASGWRDFDQDGRCVITLRLPVTLEQAVQVVVGVSTLQPQTEMPCAIELRSISALRSGDKAEEAGPALPAAMEAVTLEAAPRFERVVLGGQYGDMRQQSLDVMVQGLSSGSYRWRELRFRLNTDEKRGASIEIRQTRGWPEVFETWPGSQTDLHGPFFDFGAGDMARLAARRMSRDGQLVTALLDLLPPLVAASVAQQPEAALRKSAWLAAAEQVAEAGRRRLLPKQQDERKPAEKAAELRPVAP
ncbi:hypothetical protein MHZ93_01485 [Roseomonas sp. ACRSG]|nr:hypothetical protein [Roseomonas sp. ACRSG]